MVKEIKKVWFDLIFSNVLLYQKLQKVKFSFESRLKWELWDPDPHQIVLDPPVWKLAAKHYRLNYLLYSKLQWLRTIFE